MSELGRLSGQGEVAVQDLGVAGPVVDGDVQAHAVAGRRPDPDCLDEARTRILPSWMAVANPNAR